MRRDPLSRSVQSRRRIARAIAAPGAGGAVVALVALAAIIATAAVALRAQSQSQPQPQPQPQSQAKRQPQPPPQSQPQSQAQPQPAGAPVADYRDVGAAAGLTARTVIGGERTKTYILETTGGGAAILDYDNDGRPDLFLVNGARLDADSDSRVASGTSGAFGASGAASPGASPAGSSPVSSAGRAAASAAGPAPTHHLYRNNGDGSFTDVTVKAGLARTGWGQGVCAGDYDNDGDVDLFVTAYGDQALYHNNGDGTFIDVTARSRLPNGAKRWNTGAAFLDVDRDGHLDLFVTAYVAYDDARRFEPGSRRDCFWKGIAVMCGPQGLAGSQNALYRANGDGTFTDVSEKAGLLKARPAFGLTPLVLDYDNDGLPDVYVANDSNPSLLFHNNGDGTFTEVGLQAGVALTADGRTQAGMGVAAADYDRDGLLDIVKTNFDDDTTSLYRNAGGGQFEDATFAGGLGVNTRFLGWGTAFVDFDRDGLPDLFAVNGHVYPEADKLGGHYRYAQRKILYRNAGGRFADVSTRAGPGILLEKASRGAAVGDLFNTGQPAILINNAHDTPTLLYNCAPSPHHGLVLQLEGTKSNRSAIGARVTVQVDGRRLIDEVRSGGSFCSQHDLRLHVGLGASRRADRIEIAWPSGAREIVPGVAGDQLVVIREGKGIVRQAPFAKSAPRRVQAICAAR